MFDKIHEIGLSRFRTDDSLKNINLENITMCNLGDPDHIDLVNVLCQQEPRSKKDHLIFIKLEMDSKNNIIGFSIHYEEFDTSKASRYLIRTTPGNGVVYAPCGTYSGSGKVSVTKINKVVEKRIAKWLEKDRTQDIQDKYGIISDAEIEYMSNINDYLIENKNDISNRICDQIKSIKSNSGKTSPSIIVGLCFNESGSNDIKYLGDYDFFKTQMLIRFVNHSMTKGNGNKICVTHNHICSTCQQVKPEVMGLYSPYTFYTTDSVAFISGMNKDEAWKNVPVCLGCSFIMEAGKQFIDKHFIIDSVYKNKQSDKYLTLQHLILPTINVEDTSVIDEVLDNASVFTENKKSTLNSSFMHFFDLLFDEDEDFKNKVSIDCYTIDKKQSQFKLLDHIQHFDTIRHTEILDALRKSTEIRLDIHDDNYYPINTIDEMLEYYSPTNEREIVHFLNAVYVKDCIIENNDLYMRINRYLKMVESGLSKNKNKKNIHQSMRKKGSDILQFLDFLYRLDMVKHEKCLSTLKDVNGKGKNMTNINNFDGTPNEHLPGFININEKFECIQNDINKLLMLVNSETNVTQKKDREQCFNQLRVSLLTGYLYGCMSSALDNSEISRIENMKSDYNMTKTDVLKMLRFLATLLDNNNLNITGKSDESDKSEKNIRSDVMELYRYIMALITRYQLNMETSKPPEKQMLNGFFMIGRYNAPSINQLMSMSKDGCPLYGYNKSQVQAS